MIAAVATLVIGVIVGYLGQRSRMCFVGGIRDFILVRDAYLLKGLIAFGITAWLSFPLAGLGVSRGPLPFALSDAITVVLTIIGGFGVGYVSTLANGCPLRQHVLAAQGTTSSIAYLAGFLIGAVIFHAWIAPLLFRMLP
ncbi:MAG: YeeE/YedE family protein [Acidobacteria bacterium]|nr:YeeE/YedE family protein [Acidobacteriota bacterium]